MGFSANHSFRYPAFDYCARVAESCIIKKSRICVGGFMDVGKQVDYWRTSSEEDFAAAESLLEKGHLRHSISA